MHVVWRLTPRLTLILTPSLTLISNPNPKPGELMAEYLPEGTEGQTVVVELTLLLT